MRNAALMAALVFGSLACTLRLGSLDKSSEAEFSPPETGEGAGNGPSASELQEQRRKEVDRYIAEVVYQGAAVIYSVTLPSGDTLDFLDRNTLTPLPYALPALPAGADELGLPPGMELGVSELEQDAELLALAATATPFHRPSFWSYIMGEAPDAASVEDYLARYQVGGEPYNVNRLYAGLVSTQPNRGVSGYMSQYRPQVDPDSFSLIELAVACPAEGAVEEMIGIVISVDRINRFGPTNEVLTDTFARMHIEYARPANGPNPHVWDGMDGTFVANPFRIHQPGEIVPVSILNQTSVEHLMAIFQSPAGDWWIVYNGDLLGYYPASLFKLLKKGACRAAWYGEVYNPKPAKLNFSQMGSGLFADAGLLNAAHIRNPLYYDLGWLTQVPSDTSFMSPVVTQCYNRSPLSYIGSPWNSHFLFLGGPGSNNPECIWP